MLRFQYKRNKRVCYSHLYKTLHLTRIGSLVKEHDHVIGNLGVVYSSCYRQAT